MTQSIMLLLQKLARPRTYITPRRTEVAYAMRILLCNFEYPPLGGGGGVVSALLAEELATRHDVAVLTSRGPDSPPEVVENNVRVIRVPVYLRRQRAVASMVSMCSFIPQGIRIGRSLGERTQFDIINTHFVLPSGPVGHSLAGTWGIPNVLTAHGGDLYDPSKFTSPHRHLLLRVAVRYLLRRADTIVGQSRNTLENIRHYYATDVTSECFPLGIRRPGTAAASRQQFGLQDNDILLVTVGRLVERKAIDQLVSMMADLRGARVRLLIVGSGPQEQALRSQVEALNLNEAVFFLGQVAETEKFKILRMCDVYVSTSQHEGFGLVFLEAMASGLPIVCYGYGGHTDFLTDGTTGFVVSLNDLKALTDRCQTLANTDQLRSEISEQNLQRMESYYIDRCGAHYEEIFANTIDAYGARGRQH